MDIHWDDLKVFLAVARTESLSGAGRLLRMDPATVGRRMQRLETEIAAPLFVKSPQGYALTVNGQRLMDHAERAEQAVTGAVAEIGEQAGRLTGQVRIGAPDGCANFLLPQICAQLAADNPGLEIQIVASPRVVSLSRREVDMAIVVSTPSTGRLTVQKITDYHLHLAALDRYLAEHEDINNLSDLSQHAIIGYIPDMIYDKELDYLAEAGISTVDLASNSVVVQLNLIASGAGIGIVHDFALPFVSRLCPVLAQSFGLTRSFYLIRHPDDRRVERLNRVAEAVVGGVRSEVARLEARFA